MTITEDAIRALELMPVGLSDQEKDDNHEPRELESIKCATNSLRKMSYASYYITGAGGVEEVAPHAMFTEQAINEWDNVSHGEKVLAFK